MTTRVPRLWQPGCPRPRVFLPDFWMKLVEMPQKGHQRLPSNACAFEVDPRMSRFDVREYLEKIYKLPVRDVRTRNQMGHITYHWPKDPYNRKALWKDEDKKYAYVFFQKGFKAEIPDFFMDDNVLGKEMEKMQKMQETNPNEHNKKHFNRNRAGVGHMLPR